MKTTKYILTIALALCCAFNTVFAVNQTYYNSVNGKKDSQLREALTALVYSKHTTNVGYNWDFENIDVVGGEVLDMYSTCVWTSSQQGKNYSGICDGYNREHVVPQNLFSESLPQKGDRHHLFLTDGKVNGMRSSYPFGETNVTTGFSGISNNDKALGKLGTSSGNFSGTVYEPDDEYKGDIARAIMYMVIRYATTSECRVGTGATNAYPVTAWSSSAMFSGSLSTNYGLSNAAVAVYMAWHRADAPSAKEIARNNGVEALQGNRNPFIDYPDLAEYLWGNKKNTTVVLDDLTPTFTTPCTGKWDTPDVTAVAGDGQITLTWQDVTGASSYTVHIGAGEGYTTECSNPSIGTITHSGTTNTCVITGLVNGLSYTTSVVAKGGTTCDSDADTDTSVPSDIPADVTVTFNANGGTGTMEDQTIPYNTATNLTANSFSRTGYTFQGWATTSSGPKAYDDEDEVTLTSDLNLFAVWQKNSHNVTFTPAPTGATVTVNSSSTSPKSVEYGETVTISITPDPAYEINSVTATGVSLSGSGNTRTFTMLDADVTVTVTMALKPTYAIKFFNMETQVGETQNLYVGATATLPAAQTACDGYTFLGWWTAALAEDNTTSHAWITSDFTVTEAANKNYYAVYSKTEGSGGGSSTPATLEASYSSHEGWTISGTGGSSYWILKEGASITSPTISDLSTVTSITFKARTYGGSAYNTVNVTTSGSENVGSATASSTSMVSKTISVSGLTGSGSIVFSSSTTTSSNGPGINDIVINYSTGGGGSSTTYYTTAPNCFVCTNKVTLTKGTPSNGSFSLDKANGEYENCEDGGFVVTVSDITPAEGYEFDAITQTGIASGVTIDQNAKTVTYDKDVAGSSTINVTFKEKTKYAIRFFNMGTQVGTTQNLYVGATATLPSDQTACDGYSFLGWWTAALAEDNTTSHAWITSDFTVSEAADQDYYAVYEHSEGGGGSSTPATLEASYSSHEGWTISGTGGSSYWILKEGASITSPTISDLSTITSITFKARTYGGSAYNTVNVTTTGSENVGSATASSTSMVGKTISVSGLTGSGSIVFSSSTTSSTNGPGINDIVINYSTGGGSSTTYYTTAPDCIECTNKVTLTKGDESHGTFTLNKADGEYNNCTSNFVVTVSSITPESGYYFTGVTATGGHNTVTGPDGSGNYTVTYDMGNAVTSTITANFAPNPTYAVTWSMDGDESTQVNYEEGAAIAFPGTATGCDDKTFMGWTANPLDAPQDDAPTYVTSATMPAHPVTYYAVYADEEEGSGSGSGGGTPTIEKATSIAVGDEVILVCENREKELNGISTTSTKYGVGVDYSTTPAGAYTLTVEEGSSTGTFSFKHGSDYLYWSSSNTLNKTTTKNANASWTVSFSSGNAVIANAATTTRVIRWNNGSPRFACYEDGQEDVQLYKITSGGSGSGKTYSNYTTSCGAGINAKNIGWITAAKGQKVKRVINVSAKGFDEATTLTAVSGNAQFTATLGASAVPSGKTGLSTTLTVEYTPTASSDRIADVEITLSAGGMTKTITVSGRSVPDEFVLITKKNDTWYALPANMNSGEGEYDGVTVVPNNPDGTPTAVAVSPATILYSLASNAASRYAENGHLVRLVGNDDKCLWSNMATTTGKTHIQNKTSVATAATKNHEWLLSTTDGYQYTIANPNHPQYPTRRLAYGDKFGLYDEQTVFYIVEAGCTSQPGDVNVSARRAEATFSWESNASSVEIAIYADNNLTDFVKSETATSSPYVMKGLTEETNYWFKLIPAGEDACAVIGSFKTTGPTIDIAEWQEDAVVIQIDHGDVVPSIIIDGQEEHGSITGGGGSATELFFAKYFEGAGSMKLLSIFNGTNDAITLSGYKFVDRHAGSGASSFGSDVEYDLTSLGSINAGQEIIFFTRPKSTEVELSGCSTDFLNSVATKDKPTDNPRWIECASGKFADKAIEFNGNDAILLKKNGTIIDVIGALNKPGKGSNCSGEDAWEGTIKNMDKGKSPSDPVFDAFYETSSKSPVTKADSIALLAGFGINLSADEIDISTARCIFFRDKRVTSGDSAVLMNAGDNFVTFTNHDSFKSEWYGRSVCMTTAMKTAAGVTNDAQATCNSYQDIANMDYNEYYIDYTSNVIPEQTLNPSWKDDETNLYTIPIPEMSKYTCLNLRFRLTKGGEVITEVAQQVPILITGDVDTNDPLFSELVVDQATGDPSYSHSVTRCSTCDVVVLGTGTLTKGADTDPKDVPEVGNIKIYPGGKLIVPESTTYTANSLAFRRQEDNVSTADIQGTLNIKKTGKNVFFDLRIDPTNWHFISLPYDCNVSDIRYINDEEHIPAIGTDFLLQRYDGEKRAATQAGDCWEPLGSDAVMKKGIGYIFAIPGEGKVQREFRFPMANAVIAEDTQDKLVSGIYGYGCDKDYTQVRANHRGWNLLGNPYLLPYKSDIANPVMTGYIVPDYPEDPEEMWDGHYKFADDARSNLRYIVEPVDNGWSEYRQVAITNYSMTPFTCYFVQIGGTNPEEEQGIDFSKDQVTGRQSIVRRAPAEYEEVEDTHPVWCAVTLTNAKGETDETTMLISNDFTDDYDIMNDLVKMRGTYYQYAQITTKPVFASRNAEGEMAFNALPDASAEAGIPLHYFAAAQGTYTIAYDDKYDKDKEVVEVKLLDTKTNEWYDLMSESYSFTSSRVDNKDRFILSVRVERKKTPEVATDIENGAGKGDRPRKVLIDDHVYILRGGIIYDITGKQLLNH